MGAVQPDVRTLRSREDVGRAISREEEAALLEACRASRSRSLFPTVLIALNTCMRYSELRMLEWVQVDLRSCILTVGHSKTESGTGRVLPLNDRAVAILGFWRSLFPSLEPQHFVFPAERYGASGDGVVIIYESDPTLPIGRWKEAWETAKARAGVSCRFHDLGTPDVLERWRQAYRFQSLLRSWDGVRLQRFACLGVMATLDRPLSARPSTRCTPLVFQAMGHRIGHCCNKRE